MQIRDGSYPHLERWLAAFEKRPSYIASKADYYSTIMALPSQNGPGYTVDAAKEAWPRMIGLDGGWELPMPALSPAQSPAPSLAPLEPLAPLQASGGEEAARHEAAFALIHNHESVVRFAARGASELGVPSAHAELADPNAEPNEAYVAPVDVCLRHVAATLLDYSDAAKAEAVAELSGVLGGKLSFAEGWDEYADEDGRNYFWNEYNGEMTYTPPTRELDACLAYLRDRVGVPRDMGQGAAVALRAQLNWAIALMRRSGAQSQTHKLP